MSIKHEGLPVAGYNPQTADKIAIVNANKVLEERCLRAIDAIMAGDPCGHFMAGQARTNIEQGFMWLNRAVFLPSRIQLPEET